MRQLLFTADAQCPFPVGGEPSIDPAAPLSDNLYALWLPTTDPRIWFNAGRLNAKRMGVPSEYWPAYSQRRTLSAAAPPGLSIPSASGGNTATPFGTALACSNEQVGWGAGSIGDAPSWTGDGSNKTITVCLWFRINRVNGSGYPTLCGTSFSTGWWIGLRTSTASYKAIFRNGSFPYGAFEWGAFNSDLRNITCVAFVLPFDANGTASVYYNGVLAVQSALPNGSTVSGYANIFPLSSSNTGMFAEIFGVACWTRTLYPDEIRQVVSGPRIILAKRQAFWYGPLLAYRDAEVTGTSGLSSDRRIGKPRSALISGSSRLAAQLRPPLAPSRIWLVRPEARSLVVPAESRTLVVRRDKRRIEP
jgi:hypothetical protein